MDKSKVLIVDDEFRIALLIKKLIAWEAQNMTCIGVADNGEDAYHFIMNERPDIVITDIRMPKMSGLDMIRMVKEQNVRTTFIVISGYKEFEYAHQALQYGVKNYLLKPIAEDELNEVLKILRAELLKETEVTKQHQELKKTVLASERVLKRELLNNIIESDALPTIGKAEADYNVTLGAGFYRGLDIKLDYYTPEKNDEVQDGITVEKIIGFVQSELGKWVTEKLVCEKEHLHIYCMILYEPDKAREIKNLISSLLSVMQNYLMGFEQYYVTIGVGEEKQDFGQIRFSIKEAAAAIDNRIKLGVGRLIYYESIPKTDSSFEKFWLTACKDEIEKSIETYSKEGLASAINQIYSDSLFSEKGDFSKAYQLADAIITLFFDKLEVQSWEDEVRCLSLKKACQHTISVKQQKDLLKFFLGNYLAERLQILETESTKPIREAKKYIDEHYCEKVTLEDIAEVVELNPVYFSVLFKQELRMNFSAYLLNRRIEAAKKMLCNSNETIAAIADKIGYKDTRYFSQIFTKTVGIKPALYRKLHS